MLIKLKNKIEKIFTVKINFGNLILLLLFSLSFLSNISDAQIYNFRRFSTENGLPESNIEAITQNAKGYLFIGTTGGLSIFNGIHFNNLSKSNGLASNYIIRILKTNSNKVIIGTSNGLSIYDEGQIKSYLVKSKKPTANIILSLGYYNNQLLVGTENGIKKFVNGQFYDIPALSSLKDKKIIAIKEYNNNLWLGTNDGLFSYKDSLKHYGKRKVKVYDILIQKDGVLWAATNNGVVKIESDGTIKYLEKKDGLPSNLVYTMAQDSSKNLWFGTAQGLSKYDGEKFITYSRKNGLESNLILSLYVDSESNLWVGTQHGIYLFNHQSFLLFNRALGIKTTVWSIFQNVDGTIWAGTDGSGVIKFKNGFFRNLKLSGIPTNTTVWSIYKDSEGNIWFGTNNGVVEKRGKKFYKYLKKNGFTGNSVIDIYQDRKGVMWFATLYNGLYYYKNFIFKHINKTNGLNNNTVYQIDEDNTGNIWAVTSQGLNKIVQGKVVGFPDDSSLKRYSLLALSIDPSGNLLLGTYEKGVIYYNQSKDSKKRIDFISEKDGLNDNSIMFLQFDKNFDLWIGTNKGLNKFDYLNYLKTGEKKIFAFNKYDGIPGVESNQNSSMIDKEGNLWFATTKGIVRYNFKNDVIKIIPPKIYLTGIDVDYEKIDLNKYGNFDKNSSSIPENLSLPYNFNNLTFHFIGLYLTNSTSVKYKCRLIGFSNKFSPWSHKNSIAFSNLSPGKYTFEVMATNDLGLQDSNNFKYSFVIQTPFWKSIIFYILVGLVLVLLVYFFYKLRVRGIKIRNRELKKLIEKRYEYEKRLEESETDYKNLFENAHDAILICEIETKLIIDANKIAEELYGYNKEELKGLAFQHLVKDRNEYNNVGNIFSVDGVKEKETVHVKKDGTEIQLSLNAANINYRNKKAVQIIIHDISAQKEVERNLIKAKAEAEKSDNLKTEFLAQMSHEIRTPINTMLSYTSLLSEELYNLDNTEINEFFTAIDRAGMRIIRTIDLILNMSELQAGTYEPLFDDIDLYDDILDNLILEYKQRAIEKGLELTLEKNTLNSKIFGDEYTVTQIFTNLIDNSVKYTKKGSIQILVGNNKENKVFVEVKDTGIGIDERYLPHLFDPFSQEQMGYTRAFEGNGLGMALVKKYCDMNKAEIFVTSKKGEGTQFTVVFN